jgi:hypothetical protein
VELYAGVRRAVMVDGVSRREAAKRFGGPLDWERLDAKRASRIRVKLPGGYRAPEDEWEAIQTPLVDAMNRLDAALRPALQKLKLGA